MSRARVLGCAAVVGLLFAACGGSTTSSSETAPTVTVGATPGLFDEPAPSLEGTEVRPPTPASKGGPFLRFRVPVGSEWVDTFKTTLAAEMALAALEVEAGTPSEADVAKLRAELDSDLDDAKANVTSTQKVTSRVVARRDDGALEVTTTLETTTSSPDIPAYRAVMKLKHLPDGTQKVDDVQIDGDLPDVVKQAIEASTRSSATQAAGSAGYKLPLRAGATQKDPVSMSFNVPIPGFGTKTVTVEGENTTTYLGRQRGDHRFRTSGRFRLKPIVLDDVGRGVRRAEVAIEQADVTGDVRVQPDGRPHSLSSQARFTLVLVMVFGDGGDRIRATFRMPITTDISIRRVRG